MLELKDICVSFRSERQDKLFGTSRDQVLFDVSDVRRGQERGVGTLLCLCDGLGDSGISVSLLGGTKSQ